MKMKFIAALKILIYLICIQATATTFTVKPENIIIQIPVKANASAKIAAQELQKHLKLITGTKVPVYSLKVPAGKYIFHVGIIPSGDKSKLQKEEARYNVTKQGTWIYGEDYFYNKRNKNDLNKVLDNKYARTGTLFAVYCFLENEFKVKWPAPGDNNIIVKKEKKLSLKTGKFSWIPRLKIRRLWSNNYSNWFYKKIRKSKDIPSVFKLTKDEQNRKRIEEKLWQRRMRMGQNVIYTHQHAFVRWWNKYGKSHPEFFALNENGERKPLKLNKPARICMCVSNPEFQQEIVRQWLKKRQNKPYGQKMLNICENDSARYCRCPECRKLDASKKGETFGEHMTDRYIAYANSVLQRAGKHVPDVKVCIFAYQEYRFPPRKTRVDKNIVLSFVPKLWNTPAELDALYQGWQKMGAQHMLLRTNGFHIDTGLPMGFEKTMFDNFKIGVKNKIDGIAYDAILGFWPSSGIACYIMARGCYDPSKSFEHWEQEYYDSFGNAAKYIKQYYQYWRCNVWEKRIYPNRLKLVKQGFGFMRGGLYRSKGKYYQEKDFNITDKILQKAATYKLRPEIRRRVQELVLANQHARKLFHVMRAGTQYNTVDFSCVKELQDFRIKNKDKIQINWGRLINVENIASLAAAVAFTKSKPVKRFKSNWFFQIDPDNIGLKESWYKDSYPKIRATWDNINILTSWENANTHPELKKLLKNYDGIGWYAQQITLPRKLLAKDKKLYIRFGAVDESCQVFVNGQKAGEHLFKKPDDWKTPFKIRIDQLLKTNKITVVVRVEDKKGAGGIWKPVWLVTDK